MTQSVYDTRVFYKHTPRGGFIIAHVHVDDTRLTASSMLDMEEFYSLWARDLGEEYKPLSAANLDETFAGVRHHFLNPHTCVLTCLGTIDLLAPIIDAHPLPVGISVNAPLGSDSLKRLFAAPCPLTNPLVVEHLLLARRIVGLTSFISNIRSEVLFAFKVLSRFVNERRLTEFAWREIRRMASYLIDTRDLGLTLTKTGGSLTAYVDSSLANGPDGRSFGGFALQFTSPDGKRSGSFSTTCTLPTTPCDASGAAELFQSVRCTKAILGFCIFLRELGQDPTGPTNVYTDDRVLVDGTNCKKVSAES